MTWSLELGINRQLEFELIIWASKWLYKYLGHIYIYVLSSEFELNIIGSQ